MAQPESSADQPPASLTEGERKASRSGVISRLTTAVEQLLADGVTYAEIGIEDLITQAGVARSTFYVYFDDKGALLRALAEELTDSGTGFADAWWALGPGFGRADLRGALEAGYRTYLPHRPIMAAITESALHDARMKPAFSRMVSHAMDGLAPHIRLGQEQGIVRGGLDPERTAFWLIWMLERGFYLLFQGVTEAQEQRQLDALTELLWRALYEGAPACRS